jgi:hypothetical protein
MESRFEPSHLTDEQFTDLLLGATPAPVQDHLKACSQCAQEAERVSGAIGSFEQQSRLWAERRVSGHPILVSDRRPAFASFTLPQAWTAAAALMIALTAAVGLSHRTGQPQPVQQVASVQTAPEVSPATLKADNELLSAIDGELRADESTPAAVYGLTASTHARTPAPKRIAN